MGRCAIASSLPVPFPSLPSLPSSGVRRDLALPELLVIQVGITTGQGKFIEPVREAQKVVRIPWLKYVDAKGLPMANDYTHLTTPTQIKLDKMLAKAVTLRRCRCSR
uniref:Sialate O-acetylesterase domain-containing protein n=1 Tax=Oryza glumipatula TaxID=40148 RepID=A0A0D9ZB63_9ORYZ